MTRTRVLFAVSLIAALGTIAIAEVGCGDAYSALAGTEGAACYANGTCDAPLECLSNTCVRVDGGAANDASVATDAGTDAIGPEPRDGAVADTSVGDAAALQCSSAHLAALAAAGMTVISCTDFDEQTSIPAPWITAAFPLEAGTVTIDPLENKSAPHSARLFVTNPAPGVAGTDALLRGYSAIPVSGTYTVSFDVYLDTPPPGDDYVFSLADGILGVVRLHVSSDDGGASKARWLVSPTPGSTYAESDASTLSVGSWHHAVVKLSDTLAVPTLDGVPVGSFAFSTDGVKALGLDFVTSLSADASAGPRIMHVDNVVVSTP